MNFEQELNAEQYAAVSAPDGPALVIAAAGTGQHVITSAADQPVSTSRTANNDVYQSFYRNDEDLMVACKKGNNSGSIKITEKEVVDLIRNWRHPEIQKSLNIPMEAQFRATNSRPQSSPTAYQACAVPGPSPPQQMAFRQQQNASMPLPKQPQPTMRQVFLRDSQGQPVRIKRLGNQNKIRIVKVINRPNSTAQPDQFPGNGT